MDGQTLDARLMASASNTISLLDHQALLHPAFSAPPQYLYDPIHSTIHFTKCRCVQDMMESGLTLVPHDTINDTQQLCPVCRRDALFAFGADDFEENYQKYRDLFDKHDVRDGLLRILYYDKKFRTHWNKNKLYINGKYDNWLLEINKDQSFTFYHSNYARLPMGKRRPRPGYHTHTLQTMTLPSILLYLTHYRYNSYQHKDPHGRVYAAAE